MACDNCTKKSCKICEAERVMGICLHCDRKDEFVSPNYCKFCGEKLKK